MGDCATEVKEIRHIYEPELTTIYVLMEAKGDCPLGVQGWHFKVFPASKDPIEMWKEVSKAVIWPQKAPEFHND